MTETELLQKAGSMEKFTRGQPVFSQHDTGNEMYVVLKGSFGVYIDTFTGFPSRVAVIGQGSFFGEMAVIDGSPRSATVVSEDEPSIVVKIDRSNFGLLLENAPNMANAIVNTLKNRVISTSEAVKKSGKVPPKMPELSTFQINKDANYVLDNLALLAGSVRKMNNLIAGDESSIYEMEDEFIKALELEESEDFEKKLEEELQSGEADFEPEDTEPDDRMRLLPKEYKNYNITDLKVNTSAMREIGVVCPYCSKSIRTYAPIYGQLGDKTESLDGRIIYSNLNILFYTNTVCPNCNYCDTNMDFSKPRSAADPPEYTGNQFENAEEFTGFERPLNRTVDEVIKSYYLNLECLKRTTNDPLKYANSWIRLYWLYTDRGSTELSVQAAKQARHYYSRYSENESRIVSVEDKMRLNAILGEMSVVLGDFDRAIEEYTLNLNIGKNLKLPLLKESSNRLNEIKKMVK